MAAVDFPSAPFEFERQIIISCVRYHIVIMFGQSYYISLTLPRDLCTFYIYDVGPLTRLFSHAVSGLISAVRPSIISPAHRDASLGTENLPTLIRLSPRGRSGGT